MKLDICHRMMIDPCGPNLDDGYCGRVFNSIPERKETKTIYVSPAFSSEHDAAENCRDWDEKHRDLVQEEPAYIPEGD